jgi:hypothetical protein
MKNKLTVLALFIFVITSMSFAQPTLTAPSNASHSSSLTPTFTWTATTGPYTLEISNSGAFAGGDIIFTNAAAVSPYVYVGAPALTYGTHYWWRITDSTPAISVVSSFWTVPDAVTLIAPPNNGATGVALNIALSWNSMPSANYYVLEVNDDNTFTNPVEYTYSGSLTTAPAATGLSNNTAYYWRVRASGDGGTSFGAWTAVPRSFTTLAIPAAPTLSIPASFAPGQSILESFTWNSVSIATSYHIQVSTASDFLSGLVVDNDIAGVASTTWDMAVWYSTLSEILINGTNYYWHVSATNSSGTSAYSSYREFTTVSAAMPYLSYPTNGLELSGTSTTFQWYTLPYTSGIKYDLQYRVGSSGPFTSLYTGTNNYYIVNNSTFDAGTQLIEWRVIAESLDGSVIIDYSNIWQFSTPGLPKPFAAYPTGNVTIYTNPPTLWWYTLSYNPKVTQYVVRYHRSDSSYPVSDWTSHSSNSSSTTNGIFATGSINQYITIPIALSNGFQYYWEVAAWDGSTTISTTSSSWSANESFTLYGNAAFIACYLSYPVGGITIYSNPTTLYWYTNTYAPGITYTIKLYKHDKTHLFDTYPSSSTSVTTATLDADHYYWTVQASLGSTPGILSDWGDFIVPSTTAASAPVPTLGSPTAGIIVTVTNPTLSWFAYSATPIQYKVIVATDPDLASGVLHNGVLAGFPTGWLSTNSYILSNLAPGATYYWQVESAFTTDLTHPSSWSTIGWFTVSPGAASVVPIAANPIGGTSINNTSAVLSWVLPAQSSSQLTYTVQYGKKADLSDAKTSSNLNAANITLNGLDKGSTYYWRAASSTTDGSSTSGYSGMASFKTGGVTAVEDVVVLPTEYSLSQNYPNPFNPTTIITYSLPKNSFVTLKVYDMLGREVKTLINNEMAAGTHTLQWNGVDNFGTKVASGSYIYRITSGDFVSVKKMVLIK